MAPKKGSIPWNYSLTKETNAKLASMAVAQSAARLGRTDLNVWNKGLTKFSDPRIKAQGELVSNKLTGFKRSGAFKAKISVAFSGEKHPNWKGGCTDYRGSNWSKVRETAKLRDNCQCQFCGVNTSLVVHHIVSYMISKDNSLENLVTLCRSCHCSLEWEITKLEKCKQGIVRAARKLVELGRNNLALRKQSNKN